MEKLAENLGILLITMVVWGVFTAIVQVLLQFLPLSRNLATLIGIGLGFIMTFLFLSYVYYRKEVATSDSPSFLQIWRLMFKQWRDS